MISFKKHILPALYGLLTIPCIMPYGVRAQVKDTAVLSVLIHRIAAAQVRDDSGFFMKGIFPSYITSREQYKEKKKDNDVFFNAIIAYTLGDIRPYLPVSNQKTIDSIAARSVPLYARFKNKKGRNTYNFWRRDTLQPFPYSKLLNAVNKDYDLPDDLDDSALLLLALGADSAEAQQLHLLMQGFVADNAHTVRTGITSWKRQPVYSAWFGKKFPVVPDVSVLCNVLSFVQHYHLPWTKADTASLQGVVTTIDEKLYNNSPMYASPYYGKEAIILYHIARLMDVQPIPALEQRKQILIKDALTRLAQSNDLFEQLLLCNALLKWGYKAVPEFKENTYLLISKVEKDDYPFFIGNIPAYFKDGMRRYFTRNRYLMYYHYCPAYNDAVLLEYLVLKGR